MTVIEKKRNLKNIIDSLSMDQLNEALFFVEELTSKDKKRIDFVNDLLKTEKSLFEKLAQ